MAILLSKLKMSMKDNVNGMKMNCDVCNEEIRKDTFFNHMKKEHPTYFWDEIYCPLPFEKGEDGRVSWTGLKSNSCLKDAIEILKGNPCPWDIGDDSFLDFGNGTVYKKYESASRNIAEHPGKHSTMLYERIMAGLTPEKLAQLFEGLLLKPVLRAIDPLLRGRHAEEIRKMRKRSTNHKRPIWNVLLRK